MIVIISKKCIVVFLVLFVLTGCNPEPMKDKAVSEKPLVESIQTITENPIDESKVEKVEKDEETTIETGTVVDNLLGANEKNIKEYDRQKWTSLKQGRGIGGRIYYGNNTVLRADNGGAGIYKYDLIKGEPIWQTKSSGILGWANSYLMDGIFYLDTTEKIIAINEKTGEIVQEYIFPEINKVYHLNVYEEYVLVSMEDELISYNKTTGEVLWKIPYKVITSILEPIQLVDGNFILVELESRVYAINAETGEEEWSIETPDIHLNHYFINNDSIFVFNFRLNQNILVKYDIESQKKLLEYPIDRNISNVYPVIYDNIIYYIANNMLIALDINYNKELWRVDCTDYYLKGLLYENGKLYLTARDNRVNAKQNETTFFIIDAVSGSIMNKLLLEGIPSEIKNYYVYDGKIYYQAKGPEDFYYIFDEEDVNRAYD